MEKAHLEITGIGAIIKPPELPKTEFEPVCYPSGELDITYLSNLLTTSSSLQYMAGYHSRVG